jgi:hypothetical protein
MMSQLTEHLWVCKEAKLCGAPDHGLVIRDVLLALQVGSVAWKWVAWSTLSGYQHPVSASTASAWHNFHTHLSRGECSSQPWRGRLTSDS